MFAQTCSIHVWTATALCFLQPQTIKFLVSPMSVSIFTHFWLNLAPGLVGQQKIYKNKTHKI
jgi:hypothetical protein